MALVDVTATETIFALGEVVPSEWIFRPGPAATGSSLATAPADTIAKSAVVDAYSVTLTASGNAWVAVAAAGQARKSALAGSGAAALLSVVVDFGALVTVDAVALAGALPYVCYRVTPWNGSTFAVNANVY